MVKKQIETAAQKVKAIREIVFSDLPLPNAVVCIMAIVSNDRERIFMKERLEEFQVRAKEGLETSLPNIDAVIGRLYAIRKEHGSDLVVQTAGNDIGEIQPVIWSPEEQTASGGGLRDCVMLRGG